MGKEELEKSCNSEETVFDRLFSFIKAGWRVVNYDYSKNLSAKKRFALIVFICAAFFMTLILETKGYEGTLEYISEEYILLGDDEALKAEILRKREVANTVRAFFSAHYGSIRGNLVTFPSITPEVLKRRKRLLEYNLEAAEMISHYILNDKKIYIRRGSRSRHVVRINNIREAKTMGYYLASCSPEAKLLIKTRFSEALHSNKEMNDRTRDMIHWALAKIDEYS